MKKLSLLFILSFFLITDLALSQSNKPEVLIFDKYYRSGRSGDGYTKFVILGAQLGSKIKVQNSNIIESITPDTKGIIAVLTGNRHNISREEKSIMQLHSYIRNGGNAIIFLLGKRGATLSNLFIDLFNVGIAYEEIFTSSRIKSESYMPLGLEDKLVGTSKGTAKFSPVYLAPINKEFKQGSVCYHKSSQSGKERVVAVGLHVGKGKLIIANGLFKNHQLGSYSRMYFSDENIDLLDNEQLSAAMIKWLLGIHH